MKRRMFDALVRANERAHQWWLDSTRLEDAILDDMKLCRDEEWVRFQDEKGDAK